MNVVMFLQGKHKTDKVLFDIILFMVVQTLEGKS